MYKIEVFNNGISLYSYKVERLAMREVDLKVITEIVASLFNIKVTDVEITKDEEEPL